MAAGPQHPVGLADRRAVVGDRAKRQRAGHGVEALIVERERLDASFSQLDPAGNRGSLAVREGQHRRAELDPGEVDPGWVVAEVAAGADRELKHLAGGLRANPFAAVGQRQPLEQGDLTVIALGGLLIESAAPVRCCCCPPGDGRS